MEAETVVTIRQIAQRAGVSTATVSNVIHGKIHKVSSGTVERIQKLMDEMGYAREAGSPVARTGGVKLVAVLVHYTFWFENSVLADPFYGVVIGSIEAELRRQGAGMLLCASVDMEEILQTLRNWDVDGILAISFSCEECGKLAHLLRRPILSIDAYGPAPFPVPNIGLADEEGGFLMLRHLMERGYRNVYMAGGANDGIDHLRWMGARRASEAPEFQARSMHLEFLPLGLRREVREERYREIVRQVPFRRKTAFFFCSDWLAMEAMGVFAECDVRIPQDVGVAGFDDSFPAAHFSIPRLTTIHQDVPEKARMAVEGLMSLLRDPSRVPENRVLPVSLVRRQSV